MLLMKTFGGNAPVFEAKEELRLWKGNIIFDGHKKRQSLIIRINNCL